MEKILPSNTENKKTIKHKRRFGLFVISVGLFMLSSLLLSSCSSLTNQDTNKTIAQIAFSENTTIISSDLEIININKNLLLVDYKKDDLCGFFGCLFSIYHHDNSSYQLLWSGYLQKIYPPNKKFLQVDEPQQKYPCLHFNQVDFSTYKKLTYCFNGENYQLTKSNLYL